MFSKIIHITKLFSKKFYQFTLSFEVTMSSEVRVPVQNITVQEIFASVNKRIFILYIPLIVNYIKLSSHVLVICVSSFLK